MRRRKITISGHVLLLCPRLPTAFVLLVSLGLIFIVTRSTQGPNLLQASSGDNITVSCLTSASRYEGRLIGRTDEQQSNYYYYENFEGGSAGWRSIIEGVSVQPDNAFSYFSAWDGNKIACVIPCDWRSKKGLIVDGYLESRSPWWIDPNHKYPGAGFVNVIAYKYIGSTYGGLGRKTLDLTGACISVRIMVKELNSGDAHLWFWFQSQDSRTGKTANFALTKYPIDSSVTPNVWSDITLVLSPLSSEWACLGSSFERQDFYGCSAIEEALRDVNINFGFIILPVNPDNPPTGIVRIDNISIYKPPSLYIPIIRN